MLGTPSNPGVIPRVLNELFHLIEEDKVMTDNEWVYKVTFSYLEIYQEKVRNIHSSLEVYSYSVIREEVPSKTIRNIYCRTSMARTLMARLPQLFQTHS